jgi:dTDP-4-dehydrorhamnose reductase
MYMASFRSQNSPTGSTDEAEIKVRPEATQPVPTSAFPLPDPHSKNSRPDTQKLKNTFSLNLPVGKAASPAY